MIVSCPQFSATTLPSVQVENVKISPNEPYTIHYGSRIVITLKLSRERERERERERLGHMLTSANLAA